MLQIAVQQMQVLIQALAQAGFDSGRLARQAELGSAEQVRTRPWRSVAELDDLMAACREASNDEGFGLAVASSYAQMSHGTVALLALHAPSLRATLDDLGYFYRLIQDQKELSYSVEAGVCTVRFQPIGHTVQARQSRAEQIMGGVLLLVRIYGVTDEDLLAIRFEHPQPAYALRYREVFGDGYSFDAVDSAIIFRATILDRHRIESDATAYRLARSSALAEMSAALARHTITESVRQVIRGLGFKRAAIGNVAASIGIAERTLRRQLLEDGVSFQQVHDAMRLDQAQKLLLVGQLPLKQVAEDVGYESVGNFHRAFKRMTGQTPAQWRGSNLQRG